MTPERVDEFWEHVENLPDAGIKAELLGFVRAAVEEEREACAQAAETLLDSGGVWVPNASRFAAAIRARKED